MSTVVIHNRPSLLRRLVLMAIMGTFGCVLAKALGCEPLILVVWDALRQVLPAFLDGLHTTIDLIRTAVSK